MSVVHRRLGVGERGPDFVLTGPSGTPERFYAHAGGRPIALVLTGEGPVPPWAEELTASVAGRDDVAVSLIAETAVADAYGVADELPAVVVLDPGLRVSGVVTGEKPVAGVVGLLDAVVHRGPATVVTEQAPVLLVPRVLEGDQRDRLMRVLEVEGDVETGVERSSGGRRREVLDPGYKRRRDHTVVAPDLLRDLSSMIGRRVMPEIRRAFAFRTTRFEGFKIACYDASTGGYFRPHRDNLTASTGHRVFALTVNLNGDYEGGELRFPEYGNQLYRPDAGAALVFSCAHLHEVLDVTAGRRFVLLSFLYGDPAPAVQR